MTKIVSAPKPAGKQAKPMGKPKGKAANAQDTDPGKQAKPKGKPKGRPGTQQRPGPAAGRPAVNAAPGLDMGSWARRVLEEAAKEISEEELALLQAQVKTLAQADAAPAPLPPDPTAPNIIRDRKGLKQVAARLESEPEVVIDLETSSLDPFAGEVVGVGLSADVNYYIPTGHRAEETKQLRPDQLPLDVVARELRLGKLPLIGHNSKFEFRWLRRHAGVVCHFIWDVLIAARLLASHLPGDLTALAARELDAPDWSLSKDEIKKVQFLPIERVGRYCCKDCYYTLQIYRRQHSCLS